MSTAGFLGIGVTWGPARNALGLFLPTFREEFGLSTGLAGLIAGAAYSGYWVALTGAGLAVSRTGPRILVIIGLLTSLIGMGLVTVAQGPTTLTVGLVLAGTAAGWTWAPYSEAAEQIVRRDQRPRVLAVISTGATSGLVVAGLLALASGTHWRLAWAVFTFMSLLALIPNLRALPAGPRRRNPHHTHHAANDKPSRERLPVRLLLRRQAIPLYAAAASYGVTSAFYFTFAADVLVSMGALPPEVGAPTLYILLGTTGVIGIATGDAINRYGIRPVVAAAFLSLGASSALLAATPGSWAALIVSGALAGTGIMTTSALLAEWNSQVFPEHPGFGFSATLSAFALGLALGPPALGVTATSVGLPVAFTVAAGLSFVTAAIPTTRSTPPDH